uniref:Sushi domain-containing protein n=1 Tax=Leptobrachium leishanense TaxID=445787 RepID=A0A8C5R730_9ANUR
MEPGKTHAVTLYLLGVLTLVIQSSDSRCLITTCSDIQFWPFKKEYKVNDVVASVCVEGYKMNGFKLSQCYAYGWDPPLPTCEEDGSGAPSPGVRELIPGGSVCPHPPTIRHAEKYDGKENYVRGDTLRIICAPNYSLQGTPDIRCENGAWTSPPACTLTRIVCRRPPRVQHSQTERRPVWFFDDNLAQYKCDDNYVLQGNSRIMCRNGVWEDPPVCLEPCDIKKDQMNANNLERQGSLKSDVAKHDEDVEFKCSPGFETSDAKSLRVKCNNGALPYPKCTQKASCTMKKEDMAANNLELLRSFLTIVAKHNEAVEFKCLAGYETSDTKLLRIRCNDGALNYPKCIQKDKATGCGPAPAIQFGDILQAVSLKYNSGSVLEYKCPDLFKLEGNPKIKCWDGAWSKPPICLEPCTASTRDLKANNIELQWTSATKLYSMHDDSIEFKCLPGHKLAEGKSLRIKCDKGVLIYPTCTKPGSCVLSQSEMQDNGVFINGRTDVGDGETVTFECKQGTEPETSLLSTCKESKITYPKCVQRPKDAPAANVQEDQFDEPFPSSDKKPEISQGKCNAPPDVPNGKLTTQKQERYDTGSSVEYKCDPNFVLSGSERVSCENGQWSDPPECFPNCRISLEDLNKYNVALLSPDDLTRDYVEGSEVRIRCKPGFRRPFRSTLTAECSGGKMRYERCFSKSVCRLTQEELDGNHLELDPKHDIEVYYEDGEDVTFRCKEGFSSKYLVGRCDGRALTYPVCEEQ